jgi:hypothetical protein
MDGVTLILERNELRNQQKFTRINALKKIESVVLTNNCWHFFQDERFTNGLQFCMNDSIEFCREHSYFIIQKILE